MQFSHQVSVRKTRTQRRKEKLQLSSSAASFSTPRTRNQRNASNKNQHADQSLSSHFFKTPTTKINFQLSESIAKPICGKHASVLFGKLSSPIPFLSPIGYKKRHAVPVGVGSTLVQFQSNKNRPAASHHGTNHNAATSESSSANKENMFYSPRIALKTQTETKIAYHELMVSRALPDHAGFVKLVQWSKDKSNEEMTLILEKGECTLYDLFIRRFKRKIPLQMLKSILFQVLYTLWFGQTTCEFMHNDLHLKNILLKKVDAKCVFTTSTIFTHGATKEGVSSSETLADACKHRQNMHSDDLRLPLCELSCDSQDTENIPSQDSNTLASPADKRHTNSQQMADSPDKSMCSPPTKQRRRIRRRKRMLAVRPTGTSTTAPIAASTTVPIHDASHPHDTAAAPPTRTLRKKRKKPVSSKPSQSISSSDIPSTVPPQVTVTPPKKMPTQLPQPEWFGSCWSTNVEYIAKLADFGSSRITLPDGKVLFLPPHSEFFNPNSDLEKLSIELRSIHLDSKTASKEERKLYQDLKRQIDRIGVTLDDLLEHAFFDSLRVKQEDDDSTCEKVEEEPMHFGLKPTTPILYKSGNKRMHPISPFVRKRTKRKSSSPKA